MLFVLLCVACWSSVNVEVHPEAPAVTTPLHSQPEPEIIVKTEAKKAQISYSPVTSDPQPAKTTAPFVPVPLLSTTTHHLAAFVFADATTTDHLQTIAETWGRSTAFFGITLFAAIMQSDHAKLLAQSFLIPEPFHLLILPDSVDPEDPLRRHRRIYSALAILYQHHLNTFDFFMRVDAHSFIRPGRLMRALHAAVASPTHPQHARFRPTQQPLLLGHPIAVADDVVMLSPSSPSDWVAPRVSCLAQPGYLISRALLAAIAPVLSACPYDFPGTEEQSMTRCLRHHLPENHQIVVRGAEGLEGGEDEHDHDHADDQDSDLDRAYHGCRALDPRARWTRFLHLRRSILAPQSADQNGVSWDDLDKDWAQIRDAWYVVKNSATMLGGSWGNAVAVGPVRGGAKAMRELESLYGERGELASSTGLYGRQDLE